MISTWSCMIYYVICLRVSMQRSFLQSINSFWIFMLAQSRSPVCLSSQIQSHETTWGGIPSLQKQSIWPRPQRNIKGCSDRRPPAQLVKSRRIDIQTSRRIKCGYPNVSKMKAKLPGRAQLWCRRADKVMHAYAPRATAAHTSRPLALLVSKTYGYLGQRRFGNWSPEAGCAR